MGLIASEKAQPPTTAPESIHALLFFLSVCLWARWTIGRVKESYLKYEVAGDELFGRTLTGIPPTAGEFGVFPVYSIPDSNNKFIDQLCSFVFPEQGKNTPLIRAMIATFIYHISYSLYEPYILHHHSTM